MKKLIAPIAALTLAVPAQFALPTAAQAQIYQGPTPILVDFCKNVAAIENSPFTVGQCVAAYGTNPSGFPAVYCTLLAANDLLEYVGAINTGQCVRILREILSS